MAQIGAVILAGEIFISYRRTDEAWARLLHARLQAEGVEAWYDVHVGAGQDWRVATAGALQASRIFVLLFSQAASESEDIAKELAAATFSRKLVVPVRIENIEPTGAFLYELASRNWVNAFENREAKLAGLAQSLAKLVKAGIADESIIPFDRNAGAKAPERKRDWLKSKPLVIAAAAALVAAVTLAALFWLYPRPGVDSQPLPRPAGISIAVLPFLNLSADKDQDFFSDGITEEITSALAKVPGLMVIGRTSAFQFKGQNKDMRAIGRALGASDLIEGSVRKDGDQVRITAQLIKVDDGTHLWTESYDRKLIDIFTIQEDIATAIAGAMQVPLGLKQGQNLVSSRTDDLDAYQQYLHARALFRARKANDAIAILKLVVARDPSYAPAWALLSTATTLPRQFDGVEKEIREGHTEEARLLAQSILEGAEKAAREAIRLDPRLAIGYGALAPVELKRRNWMASEDEFRRALALDPNDPDVMYLYASFLASVGRLKDAHRLQIQILAQEPFIPQYNYQAADVLWAMGQNDAALKILEPMASNQARNVGLAKVYATVGRYAQAADMLRAIPASDEYSRQTLDDAARLIQSAPGVTGASNALPVFERTLNFVYLFVGAEDRYLEAAERQLQVGLEGSLFRDPWAPPSASLRKTERFKAFARQNGFVDYWRARGWPDACHPLGANDFACH
jgi:TolB-like protein/Tfp pilus assembly protein PilF